MKSVSVMMILIFTFFLLLVSSLQVRADGIICNKGSVYTGTSKGEVTVKCGQPLSLSRNTAQRSVSGTNSLEGRFNYQEEVVIGETWTYIIDGCYRKLVFEGDVLKEIINGGLAN